MNRYLIFALCLIFLMIFFDRAYKVSKRKRNHNYKISAANKAFFKLRSFSGEFKHQQIITYLRKIDPYVFEELVLTALEQSGYTIKRNHSYSGDGGSDGVCFLDGNKYILQVKRYTNDISAAHLRDFEKLIQNKKVSGGLFVHTGRTSGRQYANYKTTDLKIISGQRLIDLILSTG